MGSSGRHEFLPPLPLLLFHFQASVTMSSRMLSEDPHFLEACTLCSKPLGHNSDIFMYRGNNPFCSQECRQEQIEMDEEREKRWRLGSKKSSKKSKANVQTGALVAA